MEIRYNRRNISVLVVGLLAILAIGYFVFLPKAPGVVTAPTSELTVRASEFKFDLSTSTVKSGEVTITIQNIGAIPHELAIYKLSDAEKVRETHAAEMMEKEESAAMMKGSGMMGSEQAAGMMDGTEMMESGLILAEVEEDELLAGITETIKVTLAPGIYEFGCFVPGHYEAGMKATLNVV